MLQLKAAPVIEHIVIDNSPTLEINFCIFDICAPAEQLLSVYSLIPRLKLWNEPKVGCVQFGTGSFQYCCIGCMEMAISMSNPLNAVTI